MAFFRFTRDKRGYENFYLVQPTTRRGKSRTRVLYWFRSPPGVRVGREPFDEAVRRALEKQYPDVAFDWKTIVETPIPSADAEKWRERRRAERALKQAASEDDAVETANTDTPNEDPTARGDEPASADAESATESATTPAAPQNASAVSPSAPGVDPARRKRRRRRGGRRGSEPGRESALRDGAAPTAPAARPEPVGD